MLPEIEKRMNSQSWLDRETAILVLGAIASSCYEQLRDYLPVIIPYLQHLIDDKQPLIRCITCWTVSRFITFVNFQNVLINS